MVNIYQIGFPGHHNVIYLMIKFKLAVDMTKWIIPKFTSTYNYYGKGDAYLPCGLGGGYLVQVRW